MYRVKEIFGPTLQGEGVHAGRPCVFLRFAVCNLECTWCDTDFSAEGAEELAADEIVRKLVEVDRSKTRLVIVTGGEPALQWDTELATALSRAGFSSHMETNGTRVLKAPVDWLTVSPKTQFHEGRFSLSAHVLRQADECKLVVDDTVDEGTLDRHRANIQCDHFLLQPCMDADYERHLDKCLRLLEERPTWRLSLQLHKQIGLP